MSNQLLATGRAYLKALLLQGTPYLTDSFRSFFTVASKKGIPYQVLMRSFIIEGLENMKDAS